MNDKKLDKTKVVLGLSGGVDSTTAALLLQEQGFSVIGFWFDVLGNQQEGEAKARDVAQRLGIPFYSADVSREFSETIVANFCSEYEKGRTPNPCILCNPRIKFRHLLNAADALGAYYIATGHYARTIFDAESGLWYIGRATNERKDQSYMLYRLGQDVLSRLLLPLDKVRTKEEVRLLAHIRQMPNAEDRDSQEICFLPETMHYTDYLQAHGISMKPGAFTDRSGKLLGQHQGLVRYTIGQRKGLGVTFGKPMYVIRLDAAKNQVILGENDDLFVNKICSVNNFFTKTGDERIPNELIGVPLEAKIRYTARPARMTLHPVESLKLEQETVIPKGSEAAVQTNCRLLAVFEEKQRAATPGQSMVFYQNDRVVGGGFIDFWD